MDDKNIDKYALKYALKWASAAALCHELSTELTFNSIAFCELALEMKNGNSIKRNCFFIKNIVWFTVTLHHQVNIRLLLY